MVLGGGQSCHWMVVSIQASVSGSLVNFCKFYTCFDYIVINHQKGGDCNEHGTIYAIFEWFWWSYDNVINGTNGFVEWTFLDPRDEVKRPYKAIHEERTQRNAELDVFCRKQERRKNRCMQHRCIRWLSEVPTPWHRCKSEHQMEIKRRPSQDS